MISTKSKSLQAQLDHHSATVQKLQQNYSVVEPKISKMPEPPRRIVGGDATSTGLKSVTNKGPLKWHIFVGRLDPETSDDELEQFVSNHSITVHDCVMLVRKLEWHNKYATFHLIIDAKDTDNIFDLVKWPVGCDVRDWIFRTK